MSREENVKLAEEYVGCLAEGNLDGAFAMVSDGAEFWLPGFGTMSEDEIRPVYELINTKFDARPEFTRTGVTVEGNRVAIEAVSDCVLKSGRRYQNAYHFLFEIESGRLTKVHEYADSAPAQEAFFGED
jgi:ketosteroid isomerase-like protein